MNSTSRNLAIKLAAGVIAWCVYTTGDYFLTKYSIGETECQKGKNAAREYTENNSTSIE